MKPRPRRPKPISTTAAIWVRIAKITAIVVATFLVYLPSLHGGFLWDDEILITKNPLLRTWAGLAEIWSFGRTADYFPLTSSLFWIEWHVFGKATTGYHLVNIAFHIADALLIWLLLRRLRIPGGWLAGLIFAVHPVHVESVAWMSELKNVLSMFWALISFWFFLRFYDGGKKSGVLAYSLSLLSFVLALLAKTQVVFLPIALLLCLWWRDFSDRETNTGWRFAGRRSDKEPRVWESPLLLMLAPFFGAALVLGLVSMAFQNRGLGKEIVVLGGIARRLVNAAIAVWWYAGKVFVPVDLMPIYPKWRFDSPRLFEWLPVLALIVVVAAAWWWWWRRRSGVGVFVAAIGFIAAVAPVLGFIKMSDARSGALVADHLQYFADVFPIALVSAGIATLWKRGKPRSRGAIAVIVVLLVGAMASYAWDRAGMYRDEETLWLDNLAGNPQAWQAHNRLGQLYFDAGRFADALPHFEQAAKLKPELPDNHNQVGLVYCRLGRFEEGIAEYREALRLKEAQGAANEHSTTIIRINLANALVITANDLQNSNREGKDDATQRYQEALTQYREALKMEPMHPAINRNLGMLLMHYHANQEAAEHFRRVLQVVPNEPTSLELLHKIEAEEKP